MLVFFVEITGRFPTMLLLQDPEVGNYGWTLSLSPSMIFTGFGPCALTIKLWLVPLYEAKLREMVESLYLQTLVQFDYCYCFGWRDCSVVECLPKDYKKSAVQASATAS